MVDLDGKINYSEIVAIKVKNDNHKVSVFPNPVQTEVRVQIPATGTGHCIIQIQDISGKLIRQKSVQLNNAMLSTSVNVEDLSKGTYILVVQYGDSKEVHKIVKQQD